MIIAHLINEAFDSESMAFGTEYVIVYININANFVLNTVTYALTKHTIYIYIMFWHICNRNWNDEYLKNTYERKDTWKTKLIPSCNYVYTERSPDLFGKWSRKLKMLAQSDIYLRQLYVWILLLTIHAYL